MSRSLHVGMLIERLDVGGAERLVYDIVSSRPESIDFELFAIRSGGDFEVEASNLGCPVWQLGQRFRLDFTSVFRLASLLRRRELDLLHTHLPRVGVMGRLAGRLAGVPTLYTEHNLWSSYHRITRFANQMTIGMDSQIVAVSEAVKGEVLQYRHQKGEHIEVIHNGVPVQDIQEAGIFREDTRKTLGITDDEPLIFNLANLRPNKDQKTLLEALALLLPRSVKNLKLAIVGRDVGEGPLLKARASELGIADKVLFLGFREDAFRLLAAADVFVLSSIFEGFPIALLEAGALGIPCVSTCVGGIGAVIEDGQNGKLVPPESPRALADALEYMLVNESQARTMGKALQRKVEEQFSISAAVEAYCYIYNDLITAHKECDV